MITFFAPAVMCFDALSLSRKSPVLSITISTPNSPQGKSAGLRTDKALISSPSTMSEPSDTSTVP